jgi:molybdenum storage protein
MDRRKHLQSTLAGESLVATRTRHATDGPIRAILPDLWCILIGGSLFDRGKAALVPLADRIADLRARHQIAVFVGGGVRERHTYQIGIDLGLPLGGLAMIAGGIPEQNALMFWCLLASRGAVRLSKEEVGLLPLALAMGQTPVLVGQPPYHYWEYPADASAVPRHGADCGTALLADNFGCRCVLLKDVEGIHQADPARHPDARLIKHARAGDLLENGPPTLPVERALLEILRDAKVLRHVRVASGLDARNLDRILGGEDVGTVLEGNHARP